MARRFLRTKEDFICGNCGHATHGNGYTNHCPLCLWSRHVDVNPGDRAASCGGLMEPVGTVLKGGDWIIRHRCTVCGFERNNKAAPDDDFEAIVRLSVPQGTR